VEGYRKKIEVLGDELVLKSKACEEAQSELHDLRVKVSKSFASSPDGATPVVPFPVHSPLSLSGSIPNGNSNGNNHGPDGDHNEMLVSVSLLNDEIARRIKAELLLEQARQEGQVGASDKQKAGTKERVNRMSETIRQQADEIDQLRVQLMSQSKMGNPNSISRARGASLAPSVSSSFSPVPTVATSSSQPSSPANAFDHHFLAPLPVHNPSSNNNSTHPTSTNPNPSSHPASHFSAPGASASASASGAQPGVSTFSNPAPANFGAASRSRERDTGASRGDSRSREKEKQPVDDSLVNKGLSFLKSWDWKA